MILSSDDSSFCIAGPVVMVGDVNVGWLRSGSPAAGIVVRILMQLGIRLGL